MDDLRIDGRDIYEVANQLGGYVGPGTPEQLAKFLIREAEAASDLADKIVELQSELERTKAAIAYVRSRIDTGDFRSDYQRGELDACEKIEKAMNGGGE